MKKVRAYNRQQLYPKSKHPIGIHLSSPLRQPLHPKFTSAETDNKVRLSNCNLEISLALPYHPLLAGFAVNFFLSLKFKSPLCSLFAVCPYHCLLYSCCFLPLSVESQVPIFLLCRHVLWNLFSHPNVILIPWIVTYCLQNEGQTIEHDKYPLHPSLSESSHLICLEFLSTNASLCV